MAPVPDLPGGQTFQELLVDLVVVEYKDATVLHALNFGYLGVFASHHTGEYHTPDASAALEDHHPLLDALESFRDLLLLLVAPDVFKNLAC